MMKITFDTNIWRGLGPDGINQLRDHLAKNSHGVQIWETPTSLFESTFDWLQDDRYDLAAATAKAKKSLCGRRMLPAPAVIVQRLIADAFHLYKPSIKEELQIYLGLLERMQSEKFLKSGEFKTVFISSVELARNGYAQAIEGMATAVCTELGTKKIKRKHVEAIWATPTFKSLLVQSLMERFALPDYMRPYMALSSSWESITYLSNIVTYYRERVIQRLVDGRKAKPQDFLDLEQMICGTRMDKFVTDNTKDFQKFSFLSDKLWTLKEFSAHIKFTKQPRSPGGGR